MSQFLVIKDLNFDNIMICFDNSQDELDCTFYICNNKEYIVKTEDCFNNFFEDLQNNNDFEEIYTSLEYKLFFNNTEENKILIKTIINKKFDSVSVIIYTYEELDGGVYEITYDSQHDIYSSKFDDFRKTIMQVLGGYTEHIFEIEE